MRKILILFIRAYQYLISPLLGAHCRFYPTCSSYAQTAVERYGVIRGSWLAVRRLSRCHPWNAGGVDLVPENLVSTVSANLVSTVSANGDLSGDLECKSKQCRSCSE